MNAQIKFKSKDGGDCIISREVKNLQGLCDFLNENNVVREVKDMREDLTFDSATYFIMLE